MGRGTLNDKQIAQLCDKQQPMISPFVSHQVSDGISYGLSSSGYDIRLGETFKFMIPSDEVLDLAHVAEDDFQVVHRKNHIILQPGQFVLGHSIEYLRIPRNIMVECLGKSTLARVGILPLLTPAESEWEGYLTLELFNAAPRPIKLRVGEGVAQLVFRWIDEPAVSYADRNGKYQGQKREPVISRVRGQNVEYWKNVLADLHDIATLETMMSPEEKRKHDELFGI